MLSSLHQALIQRTCFTCKTLRESFIPKSWELAKVNVLHGFLNIFCMYFLWNLTRVLLRKGFTNCFTLLLLFEAPFSFIIQVTFLGDIVSTTSCINHCLKTFTLVQFCAQSLLSWTVFHGWSSPGYLCIIMASTKRGFHWVGLGTSFICDYGSLVLRCNDFNENCNELVWKGPLGGWFQCNRKREMQG